MSYIEDARCLKVNDLVLALILPARMATTCVPGSVVGIATGYGLDCPGSNPGGGEIFLTRPDWPWDLLSLLYNGYRVFPGGKTAGAWR